ncbi:MAG: PQQ-dependent sugar dehydrogenase [Vicinamibacterales bacterium]
MTFMRTSAVMLFMSACILAQTPTDPFPAPINATDGIIKVNFVEFATLPDLGGPMPARPMLLVDEPGSRRLFVNDMRGPLYTIPREGKTVALYLDINDSKWAVNVNSQGNERGFQSFALHPQFNRQGTPGFGKFYTYIDTANMPPVVDFKPNGGTHTHDAVLLEWTAKNPSADVYDGGAPRELMRFEHPFGNHNGGQLSFNPLAAPNTTEFGLLYMGIADGGSGGDPLNNAQNLSSAFGKMMRIDPLGKNSANGKYGIPKDNPFANDNDPKTLDEIYAVGVRNPQRFAWDSRTGNLFLADIGQNIVEEVSQVTKGANLGWNKWEGSYGFISRQAVNLDNPRGDSKMTFPIAEYGQIDPLLQPQSAVTMGVVYRRKDIPQLANLLIFGDNPSGEVFYVSADKLANGGQDAIRRILFNDNGQAKTLLQLIQEKNVAQGKMASTRADLRFGEGPNGEIFILNKRDGVIRMLSK